MRDNEEDLFNLGQKGQMCRADLCTAVLHAASVGESGKNLVRHVVGRILQDNTRNLKGSGSVTEISYEVFESMVQLLQRVVQKEEAKCAEKNEEPPLSVEVLPIEIVRILPDFYLADAHTSQRRKPLHVSVFDFDEQEMDGRGVDYLRAHDG